MDFHSAAWGWVAGWMMNWREIAVTAVELAVAVAIGLAVHALVFGLLRRLAANPNRVVEASIEKHGRGPSRWIFPLLAVLAVSAMVPLPDSVRGEIQHASGLGVIAALGWCVMLALDVASDLIAARHRIDISDNLAARRIRTQTGVLKRVLGVLVVILTLAIMLLTFPAVRSIGASMLASAGLAGLVIGMAAKPTLANLIAGIQIALTQPMRIEDAVIVENEWGWIEEITATYVVVRLWDWRRLVLPLAYFIEHPFQNWTRTSGSLIGSVYIYMDYRATASVPMDALRQELDRIVHATDKWLGGVVVLQVSDCREHTIELRALADAKDAPTAWDLRCIIREGLLTFLQDRYPEALPTTRALLEPLAANHELGVAPHGNGAGFAAALSPEPFTVGWRP